MAEFRPVAHWQRVAPSPSRSSTQKTLGSCAPPHPLLQHRRPNSTQTDASPMWYAASLLTTHRFSNFVLARSGLCCSADRCPVCDLHRTSTPHIRALLSRPSRWEMDTQARIRSGHFPSDMALALHRLQ
jgi:hypothetical protein